MGTEFIATRLGAATRSIAFGMLLWIMGVSAALAHKSKEEARLPTVGPAPSFSLISQTQKSLSLQDLRGSVVVLTFIFTSCKDTCPMLTAKLVDIQRKLDPKQKVVFAAITVDPEKDTPAVLARYANALGATDPAWVFLSGAPEAVRDVTRRFAVFARKQDSGDVDHTFLTSLIDRQGMIRVQYLGVRFSAKEFISDVRTLASEKGAPP